MPHESLAIFGSKLGRIVHIGSSGSRATALAALLPAHSLSGSAMFIKLGH